MLVLRRSRVHGPLLAAFAGTAMLLCGVGVAVVGLVDDAVDDGARAVASRHAGADLALRVSLDLAQDPDRQDLEVRDALATSLADLSTPFSVDRTVAGEAALTLARGETSGPERAVTALSLLDLPSRAELVAGAWAEDDDEVMVQADAAEELGLRPGQEVLLGGVRLDVAGTWRARDHLDPRWLGDPQLATGSDDGRFGPVVLAESRWVDIAAEPRARWVLVPDLHEVTAADLDAVAQARGRLDLDWTGRVDDVESLAVDGRLPDVAQEVALRADGLRAAEPVVGRLLAAGGLVPQASLAGLFASTHARELSLLWARGASSRALAGAVAIETSAAAAAGGVAGALIAGAGVLAGSGTSPTAATALLAVAAVTMSVAVLTAVQVHLTTGRMTQVARGPSGRAGRLVGPGLVALTVAAAALAVWQLRSYGSPVTVSARGVPAVDPVAVAAPAVLLVAVVLLALTLFPFVAAGAERFSSSGDVTRVLAARHLSRRLVPVTAPVLVVAIATGTLVAAGTYARTWSDAFDTTRQLRAGADVRAATGDSGPDEDTLDTVARLAEVSAVAPVATQLGGDIGSLVAVTPGALDALARGFSGAAERERAVAALTSRTSGPELPPGTDRVEVVLEAAGLADRPHVTLVVTDANGVLRHVSLRATTPTAAGALTYAHRLPPDAAGVAGPRTIAAVDLEVAVPDREGGAAPRVGLVAITATGPDGRVVLEDETWTAQVPGDRELSLVPGREAPGGDAVVDPDVRAMRFTPSFAPGSPDGPQVPALLSATAADALGLGVGAALEVALDGTYETLHVRVAQIVPAVPGASEESSVLVDLRAIHQARLYDQQVVPRPGDLWIATDAPEAVAAGVRELLPANSRIDTATDTAGRRVLATAALAWWLGAAGSALLAVLTLATVARGQLRSRRADVAVLRALGLSMRDQRRLRGRELAWTAVFGLVAGVLAGVSVALLVVPQLARAAVPEPYPTIATGLGVDLRGMLVGAALLVGALATSVTAYAWRVGVEAGRAGGPVGDR